MQVVEKKYSENPPTPLVGAGRASGALAFELAIPTKLSSYHIAPLGGAYYFSWRAIHFGCRATGKRVSKVIFWTIFGHVWFLLPWIGVLGVFFFVLGWFWICALPAIKAKGHGGSFWGYLLGCLGI